MNVDDSVSNCLNHISQHAHAAGKAPTRDELIQILSSDLGITPSAQQLDALVAGCSQIDWTQNPTALKVQLVFLKEQLSFLAAAKAFTRSIYAALASGRLDQIAGVLLQNQDLLKHVPVEEREKLLLIAAGTGHARLTQALVPDCRQKALDTALVSAIAIGRLEARRCIQVLQQAGAKTADLPNEVTNTLPLFLAKKANDPAGYKAIKNLFSKQVQTFVRDLNQTKLLAQGVGLGGIVTLRQEGGQEQLRLQLDGYRAEVVLHRMAKMSVDEPELGQVLARAASPNSLSEGEIAQLINKGEPVLLCTGFTSEPAGHHVSVLAMGGKFYLCNRGGNSARPVEVFCPTGSVDAALIKEMRALKDKPAEAYLQFFFGTQDASQITRIAEGPRQAAAGRLVKEAEDAPLEEFLGAWQRQTEGNCTWASSETGVGIYMLLDEMKKSAADFKQSFPRAAERFFNWTAKQQLELLQDYLKQRAPGKERHFAISDQLVLRASLKIVAEVLPNVTDPKIQVQAAGLLQRAGAESPAIMQQLREHASAAYARVQQVMARQIAEATRISNLDA